MHERRLNVTILGLNYAPEPTGNAPYTASLARGLADRGHAVHVLTAHPHYPAWKIADGYGGWTRRSTDAAVHLTRMRHYVPRRPSALRRLFSEISFGLRLVATRWHSPDVILLVSPGLISSAVAAVRIRLARRRIPHVVWVQDIYTLGITETGTGGSRTAAAMSKLESWTLSKSSGVVAIHPRFQDFIVNRLGAQRESVEVIRNWTHLPPVPVIDRAAERERLGWGPNETIALHAGNQGQKQGLENVVEAARLADAEGAPVRFVLLGDGNQRTRLAALARGIERIQFIDPLPDDEYQAALASADVLLVNELPGVAGMAVPSKLTSYFSTGLPVLAATDADGVTAGEIVASGGGMRVDAGVPKELLGGVLALREDPEAAAAAGERGLRYRTDVLGQDAAIEHFERWLIAASLREGGPARHDRNGAHAKL